MDLTKLQKKVFELQKSGDKERVSVLRYLLSKIKNKEIEFRGEDKELEKDDVLKIIKKQMKQRDESAELYRQGSREELAEKEEREKEILAEFLEYVQNN